MSERSEANKPFVDEPREGQLFVTDEGVEVRRKMTPLSYQPAREAIALKPEQEFVVESTRSQVAGVTESDFEPSLRALREVLEFFEHREILPIVGAGISGVFWHLLKVQSTDFIFWPVAVGPHGIGKSRATEAFSHRLYGTPLGHASDMESPFRFAAHMDSCALPRVYGEAEHFNFDGLSDLIKQGTEFDHLTMRGTRSQRLKRYAAIMAPIFNCNGYVLTDPNLRPRLLFVPFRRDRQAELLRLEGPMEVTAEDEGVGPMEVTAEDEEEVRRILELQRILELEWRADQRYSRRAFDENFSRIRPIGDLLIRDILEHEAGWGIEGVLRNVRAIARSLEGKVTTTDTRRLFAWAVYIWGILVFERLCECYLGDPFLPQRGDPKAGDPRIAFLVRNVIQPLEDYNAEERGEDIVSLFLGFLEIWMSRMSFTDRFGEEQIRGRGRVFMEKDGHYVVTTGLISAYDRENPRIPLKNLKALGEEVAARLGVDVKSVWKVRKFSDGKTRLSVKVPAGQMDLASFG